MAKKRIFHNNEKQTRQNTAKEQPYLMPGTEEYEERQEDLRMHDPFRPDDAWHDKKEQENEEYAERLAVKASEQKERKTSDRKYTWQMGKRDQFLEGKEAAIAQAQLTESLEDDKRAERMLPKGVEDIVYNDGVAEDDYVPAVLRKYE